MTQIENTTKRTRGKHLTIYERNSIAAWTKLNSYGTQDRVHILSNRAIAKMLATSPQTINNEIKRGTVRQIKRQKQNGRVYEYSYEIYSPQAGQAVYDQNRIKCGRRSLMQVPRIKDFISFADQHLLARFPWSPDQVIMAAEHDEKLKQGPIPCTTTLYNWIDQGLMHTKNIDLAEKLARKPRKKARQAKRKNLGRSIEERPSWVEKREEFGHWEIDSVVGQREKGDLNLLTLTERKTRYEEVIVIPGKESCFVNQALETLKSELGTNFSRIFKTITADNGAEFSELTQVIPDSKNSGVYYAHPYASYERASNERNNKIVRKIYPKGHSITAQPIKTARETSEWMNNTPRRSLHTQTPLAAITAELAAEFKTS